ncbi:hypothetical protein [uncultured Arthrobacter sp.]|uniref:hypothetical protein n=1 Tax=uncultured Arthrobacter sp. TaxID=114050 RepID=UPI00261CC527|nr:hypothetical protein [uncultured Arthrobacter sp.]
MHESQPASGITRPAKGVPCWVNLEWPSGRRETYPAFAQAWTSELVYVQWVEQSEGRRAWVTAIQCSRRPLAQARR